MYARQAAQMPQLREDSEKIVKNSSLIARKLENNCDKQVTEFGGRMRADG
jgi:hypothetical protein